MPRHWESIEGAQYLKGIDNATYYIMTDDPRAPYADYFGCGNTVRAANRAVRHLIRESLRYWVTEMHVDGFRFDLADPVGGQHLQSAPSDRLGEGVRVPAQEEWAVDAVRASIQANGLGDGEDVGLVESAGERMSPGVPRCRRPPAVRPPLDPAVRCSTPPPATARERACRTSRVFRPVG
jgi:glycosidase